MTGTTVKVLADSISETTGKRLTTFELQYPRVVHSELLTHRVFSKNSASSRAIPISKVIESVQQNPYIPSHFGLKNKGMQPQTFVSAESDPERYQRLVDWWLRCRDRAVNDAKTGDILDLSKQVVNRLLESFQYIRVVLSGTDWDNFFDLRTEVDSTGNPMADYPLFTLASMIKDELATHQPAVLADYEWHIPYAGGEGWNDLSLNDQLAVAVARCARVSYKASHDADTSLDKPFNSELRLSRQLATSKHWSPYEHVAQAAEGRWGNYDGFRQLRWFQERKGGIL